MQDKRQIILDTTLKLVAERGLHNTPMSLISKEATISVGTIYNYFENKDMLINVLYLELKQSMTSFYECDANKSYEERFIQLWLNAYYYINQNPQVISFLEQCSNSPIITEETKKAKSKIHETIRVFVQEGIDKGILKPLRASLIPQVMYGTILNAVESELEDTEVDAIAKFCFDGLKI